MDKFTKIISVVILFLFIITIVFIVHHRSVQKEVEKNSSYYAGFLTGVKILASELTQINDKELNEDAVKMFNVYTAISYVNERLSLMEQRNGFDDLETLFNDFRIIQHLYGSPVKSQIKHRDGHDSELHQILSEQIQLFLKGLPNEYEDSKEFSNQLREAAEHIHPLLNISFE